MVLIRAGHAKGHSGAAVGHSLLVLLAWMMEATIPAWHACPARVSHGGGFDHPWVLLVPVPWDQGWLEGARGSLLHQSLVGDHSV